MCWNLPEQIIILKGTGKLCPKWVLHTFQCCLPFPDKLSGHGYQLIESGSLLGLHPCSLLPKTDRHKRLTAASSIVFLVGPIEALGVFS